MNKDSTVKIIGVAALAIIALWILKSALFPIGYGMYAVPTQMGNSYNYSFGINNFNLSVTLLLALLIKVLLIAFVVTLFVGIVMLVKNNLFTQEDIKSIKNTFSGKQSKTNKICSECNKNLNEEWKVCPYCGKEVDKPTIN